MDILKIVLSWAIPAILGAAVSAFVMSVTMLKAIKNGVQCLLRSEIISQHEKWEGRKYCPIYAKEALTREYKAYHALGGNDVATALYDETMHLPEDKPNRKREE